MKGKRFLTRILACSLSVLMLFTAPADMVFAQNTSQDTEESVTETEEPETEMPETETADTQEKIQGTEEVEPETETIDVQEEIQDTEAEPETEASDDTETADGAEDLELQTASAVSGKDGALSWSYQQMAD